LPRKLPWLAAHWLAIRAHVNLGQGNVAEAAVLLGSPSSWQGFSRPLDLLWTCEYDWVVPARVLIAQGHESSNPAFWAQALDYLQHTGEQGEALGLIGLLVKVNILRALAYAGWGDAAQAELCVEQALALAEPEGYVRLFLEEGKPLQALLGRIRGAQRPYAERLRATSGEQAPAGHAPKADAGPAVVTEALSERELQVLRLMAGGASNLEIAHSLALTLNTVKKHSSNLFAKLAVNSRTRAVARARERHLI
jgi:LuxR family maltose regulon positive regulatory protein